MDITTKPMRSTPSLYLAVMLVIFLLLCTGEVIADEGSSTEVDESLYGIKFGVLAYLDYSAGVAPLSDGEEENYSYFKNTRGYLTMKKKMLPWLGMRMTLDMHQDDSGDYKVRHKYLYAELTGKGSGFFTNLKSEIGMGHMPWLDFEEHINPYRCQGTMAIERAGTFNSADLGISLRGYFGGKLEDAEERTGTHYYTGKWGSWHFGVYNGGGYHAPENNEDKTVQGRVTIRPLPSVVPGLQFSFLGISGKGNVEEGEDESGYERNAPDYDVTIHMVSYEHPLFVFTGQFWNTNGNAGGNWINYEGSALKTSGYSVFGKIKLPILNNKLSIWGRFDHFDSDIENEIAKETGYNMVMGSLVYDFYKGNLFMLAYETTDYEKDNGGKKKGPSADNELGDDQKIQLVWQVKF